MSYGLPVLFVLFSWWFLTGAVLWLIGLPRTTVRWSMAGATLVALGALATLWQTAGDTSPAAAYTAFLAALLVWGWHEMSFLTGMVTGPRTSEAPRHTRGRAGLWPAVETLLYHEAAILVTGLLLYAMLAGSPNEVGLWTFVILWVMRISAKLNVYLGVPNLTEEFLPAHLTYLKTYFCRRSMNLLFPLSVTLSTIATWLLIGEAGTCHERLRHHQLHVPCNSHGAGFDRALVPCGAFAFRFAVVMGALVEGKRTRLGDKCRACPRAGKRARSIRSTTARKCDHLLKQAGREKRPDAYKNRRAKWITCRSSASNSTA